LGYKVVPSNS